MYYKQVWRRVRCLLFIVCYISSSLHAGILSDEMQAAVQNRVEFKAVDLFRVFADGINNDKVLLQEWHLKLDYKQAVNLYETHPSNISIQITQGAASYKLLLKQCRPVSVEFNTGYIDGSGMHRYGKDNSVHYQGSIEGDAQSIAAITISANGEIMGLFTNSRGNFVVAALENGKDDYIVYNDKDFIIRPLLACGVTSSESITPYENGGAKGTAGNLCRKLSVYLECDYDLYISKGSIPNAQSYMVGLFNQVQALYRNENIGIELKSLYIWSTVDKYNGMTDYQTLLTFKDDWNNKADTFDGDIAHFVSMDAGTNMGIAFTDKLCNRADAYAYHDILGTYKGVPTYSFDVLSLSHEIGHSIGSPHTHWCGWNTGSGGTCGSIDNCDVQEASGSCSTCSTVNDINDPPAAWQGTIMSYCHLISRGVNFSNGFGMLPGSLIRNKIGMASCLKSVVSATLTVIPICKKDGAVIVDFDTSAIGKNNLSTPPYIFSWSNGVTTQSIYSIINPGSFSLGIADANGCSANYTVTVSRNTADSCDPVSIANIDEFIKMLDVYPNPTSKNATLAFIANGNGAATLKITDMVGRVIETRSVDYANGRNAIGIDVQGYAKGVYFLAIDAENANTVTSKLVVE